MHIIYHRIENDFRNLWILSQNFISKYISKMTQLTIVNEDLINCKISTFFWPSMQNIQGNISIYQDCKNQLKHVVFERLFVDFRCSNTSCWEAFLLVDPGVQKAHFHAWGDEWLNNC